MNKMKWKLEFYDRFCRHEGELTRLYRELYHNDSAAFQEAIDACLAQGRNLWVPDGYYRLASTLFGHKKLYFIVGKNKIAKDLDGAIWRARNVASPKNAMRFAVKTPCVASGGEKCFDCKSPERICKALLVFWERPNGIKDTEVVLIDEELGY